MKQQKAALRQQMKATRARLHASDDGTVARLITTSILMLPEMAGEVQRGIKADSIEPHIVAGFYPIQTEIDCLFILKALSAIQCRCALPVMNGRRQHLGFKEWNLTEAELKDGPYGTREPKSERLYVMPDIILMPLLAFDARGNRLGYGGGYYDRTLEAYRAKGHDFTAIGIAYDGQRCDGLPTGKHDQPFDIIVTEQGIYRP
ncbi:5-formyltetrahydrofolate cyclo-ligase [hydrothermal vent metagenome]|uniref:5-formyltetrahydrofolate cyclo-ligase n=1 Tax=hydrothermal vent metagenome TaxID=652676 RepID=A0A3B0SMM4_9ZZZZ